MLKHSLVGFKVVRGAVGAARHTLVPHRCRDHRHHSTCFQAVSCPLPFASRRGPRQARVRPSVDLARSYNGDKDARSGGCGAGDSTSGPTLTKQLRADLKQGQLKFGVFLDSGSPAIAELAGHSGWDWVLVDLQHSPTSYDALDRMLLAASSGGAATLVRVANPLDRTGMQQSLDLGANGVMVPSVETAQEVARAVEWMQLPPRGSRSIFYPMRPTHRTGLAPYLEVANEEAYIIVQIETAKALEDIDSILAVPGVDCAFVGPVDLACSLRLHEKYGLSGMFESQEFKDAIARVLRACKANGVVPGIFAFPSDKAHGLAEQGFQLLAIGTDTGLLVSATSAQFDALKLVPMQTGSMWSPRPSAIV